MSTNIRMYTCNGCNKTNDGSNMWSFSRNQLFCGECKDNYGVQCMHCSNYFIESDNAIDYRYTNNNACWICDRCWENMTQRLSHRHWTPTIVSGGKGEVVQTKRGWSAEIECYTTNRQQLASAFAKLPTTFGIGRDGSLRDIGYRMKDGRKYVEGIEITTPILQGKKGEEYLQDICKALNEKDNAQVNATCGLHIHIDMSDVRNDLETLKRILVFHWLFEPVIMSFLPASRRANIFCQSLKNDYHYKRIMNCQTETELRNVWYKKKSWNDRYNKKHPRYHGLNFHSLFQDGHAEIRYHSGTTNPKKILHWVALHTRIIDYCSGIMGNDPNIPKMIEMGLTLIGRPRALNTLTKTLFNLLHLPKETQEYLIKRQKEFKDSPTFETDFEEKEHIDVVPFQSNGIQIEINHLRNIVESLPEFIQEI